MKDATMVNIRDFEHNLSMYIEMAKVKPVIVTKYGKAEVLVKSVNEKHKKGTVDIMKLPFFGMKEGHSEKSSLEEANELRKRAWYGE